MPEGDTIHRIANRIRPAFLGRIVDDVHTPHPRFTAGRWLERLRGKEVTRVHAHGKHLFIEFGNEFTLHSHLRMNGRWIIGPKGQDWPKSRSRVWLVMRSGEAEVVQFDGPVLELMTTAHRQLVQMKLMLGPDILAQEFDEPGFLRCYRAADQTRSIGETLLDQHIVAGIGNLWKSESCWLAKLSPWHPTAAVAPERALEVVQLARRSMQRAVAGYGRQIDVYKRAGRICHRCKEGARIEIASQGEGNRVTYWCPRCQK